MDLARLRGTRAIGALATLLLGLVHAAAAAPAPAKPGCPPPPRMPTAEERAAGMRSAQDHGFLWRIRKDGRTSYLYGTLHVGRPEWMYPGPHLRDAIAASDVVALELDLLDPQIQAKMAAGVLARAGKTVGPSLTERLKKSIRAACMPDAVIGTMSPELLSLTLVLLASRSQGLDPSYASDAVLAGIGHGARKTVTLLETPERQLELLDGRTPEETETIVSQALDSIDDGKAVGMVRRLARVWADGRLADLEHYADWCDCLDSDEDRAMMKRLVDERNPGMADAIDAIHASGKSVFAAVGSLHMIGKVGLLASMRARGYEVERIEPGK